MRSCSSVGAVADAEHDRGDVVVAARRVGRDHELARDLLQARPALHDALHLVLADHAGEAVGAEQDDVALLRVDAPGVDVDVVVGAERARDDAALRVPRGLVRRQGAAPHELADERVVVRELLQRAVAQQVGPRVADVAEGDAPVVDERGGHRRAHAGGVRVVARAVVDAAVGLADGAGQRLLRVPAGPRLGARQHLDGERRGDLARVRAAHAVRDHEQRRGDEVRVLVGAPDLPDVRGRPDLDDLHGHQPPPPGR